eukprot:1079890-Amorphochlora_amoeboformis.AAC.1
MDLQGLHVPPPPPRLPISAKSISTNVPKRLKIKRLTKEERTKALERAQKANVSVGIRTQAQTSQIKSTQKLLEVEKRRKNSQIGRFSHNLTRLAPVRGWSGHGG